MSITPKPKAAIVEDSIPAFRQQYRHISGQPATAWPGDFSGSGAPSGDLLGAAQGSTYARIDGTADTSFYLKGPSGWVAVEAAGDASTVESLTVDGGSGAAITVEAGFTSALDLSAMATGEGDILLGDNLASALQVREGANVYLTIDTTDSAEAVRIVKEPLLGAGANVETLAGAKTLTVADAIFQRLDPDGSNRDVNLPAEASSTGKTYRIVNDANGAEDLVVKDDGASTIVTISQNEAAWVVCDGTAWFHMGIETIALT